MDKENDAIYHGVLEPRVFPLGDTPAYIVMCRCDLEEINQVQLTLAPDMLTWRGICEECGREHWAERGEAGVI